jgi:CheY-like chemotaxis protein
VILIVDDSEATRAGIGRLLKLLGEDSIEAANGNDAITMLECFTVEIALVDFTMPRGGPELLRRIKERWSIPVILVTGWQPGDVEGLNYDGYLFKPIDKSDLSGELKRVRKQYSGEHS